MKGRDRYVFLLDAVDEAVELCLRIGCVCQAHGGLCVTQRPAWRQVRAAYKFDELGHHLGRCAARHQVVVELAVIDLDITKQLVIVVVLAAQVKGAGGQGVVVNAPPHAAGRACHHERPVFVERVARLRVITECVQTQRAQAASLQVQRAGLVAQPVVTLGAVTRQVVAHSAGAAAGEIGRCFPIIEQRSALRVLPVQGQRVRPQAKAEPCGFQSDFAVQGSHLGCGAAEAAQVVTRAAFPGHIAAGNGRNRPGAGFAVAPGRPQAHPHQLLFKHLHAESGAVRQAQVNAVRRGAHHLRFTEFFHDVRSCRRAPCSSKKCRAAGGLLRRTV